MTPALTPACPLAHDPHAEPNCAQRLVLGDCLQRWQREAQQGELDTGRYRCRYVAWGRGPVLVLIPGMASEALSFVMLVARLQSHYRCVSYDLPAGVSDGARVVAYRHADLVADLFTLLDHLKVHNSCLLGFSFGSTIALAAAHAQPQRFARLILQGALARRRLSAAEAFVASFARFLPGTLGHVPFFRSLVERNHREPFQARETAVWDFFVERQFQTPLAAFAARALLLHRLDLRPLLPAIRQPTLLVCGDRDPLVSQASTQELRQGLLSAARAEIEQCGHQPHLTHPEVLAELVQQFLAPSACK